MNELYRAGINALTWLEKNKDGDCAVARALRKALSNYTIPVEPVKQEPFLEVFCDPSYFDMWCVRDVHDKDFNHTIHVNSKETANHAKLLIENWVKKYAAPVRTKDLTDDEIDEIWTQTPWSEVFHFARAVIAADRAKNNLYERTK